MSINLTIQDYIALLGVVFTVISAVVAAAITYYNPKKVEIREKQLERVYHPLMRTIMENGGEYSEQNLRAITRIMKTNMFLCYPHTVEHYSRIKRILKANVEIGPQDPADLKRAYDDLLISIEGDCEYLRRKVGYPTGRHIRLFSRGTVRQNLSLWYRFPILPYVYIAVVLYVLYRISLHMFYMACGMLAFITVRAFIRAYLSSKNHTHNNRRKH